MSAVEPAPAGRRRACTAGPPAVCKLALLCMLISSWPAPRTADADRAPQHCIHEMAAVPAAACNAGARCRYANPHLAQAGCLHCSLHARYRSPERLAHRCAPALPVPPLSRCLRHMAEKVILVKHELSTSLTAWDCCCASNGLTADGGSSRQQQQWTSFFVDTTRKCQG